MNSRPDDHEMTTASSRVSARSRFSASPSASSLLAQSNSASKSKGGINGRGSYDSDDDSEQGRTASRSSVRSADRKKRGGVSGAASRELGEVERDIRLARSRSSSSAASGTSSGKDRPWRTPSSGSDRKSVRAASASSGRWSQYETEDLAEESRRATSEAASRLASRLADGAGEEVPYDPAAPMGGDAGSGYGGGGGGGGDETEALQSNGNSLPGPGTSRSSTTDYVKSRLSSLLSSRSDGPEATVDYTATNSTSNQHDRVRNEALKMLKIADSCLAESPVNSPKGSRKSPAAGSGLFRTAGGGMAMRELHPEESERMSLRRDTDVSSIKGIDKFAKSEGDVPPPPRFDGRFDVGSPSSPPAMPDGGNGEDTPSLWSSRYSVERQLMAITGGLDSEHMLAKMDALHASRNKTKSARGLYRASAGAMDGSHEEYGDYTRGSSVGLGLGGAWTWIRDTFWTSGLELNSDGTTQSLVRGEKARVRRRNVRIVGLFSAGLLVAIGVLASRGRTGSAAKYRTPEMNFYVVADEPYRFDQFDQFTRDLEALPRDAEFVVHLGNANGDRESMCQEYGFERAANILKESPVPVLVVPGDLDWAACGTKRRSEAALRYWDVNLGKLESSWPHPLDVEYCPDVVGNFAFLHKSTLFVSINLVEQETNTEEWTTRLQKNVEWTRSKLRQFGDDFSNVVILGHAPPSSKQGEYFWPVVEDVKGLNRPVLYLHANSSGSFEVYRPFGEAENLEAVQLERRGVEGPMRVTIMRGGNDPFAFERRQPAASKK